MANPDGRAIEQSAMKLSRLLGSDTQRTAAALRHGLRAGQRQRYKGFPTFVKQNPAVVESRQRLTTECVFTFIPSQCCYRSLPVRSKACGRRNYKRSLLQVQFLRTLMKDARQGLHSLVEAQGVSALLTSLS